MRVRTIISGALSCLGVATCLGMSVVAHGAVLQGVIRDFSNTHPDFESAVGADPGIVLDQLGADDLPVYGGQTGNPTTHGQAYFDQWYRDVPGVNLAMPYEVTLAPTGNPGEQGYYAPDFFPIDGQLLGNTGGWPHNYHFTCELHAFFDYTQGTGESFSCMSDDDMWLFLNGRLVIDGGGVQPPVTGVVNLDDWAALLGLEPGQRYRLDLFHAERHTTISTLRIMTNMNLYESAQADVSEARLPDAFTLHENAPNPFRRTTAIAFDLPRASSVDLSIFDLAGRRVRTLVHEVLPVGRHEILWDGSADGGRPPTLGVYFCRMTAGEFSATRSILLVR